MQPSSKESLPGEGNYDRDGFLVLRGLLVPSDCRHVSQRLAELDAAGLQRSRQVLYTHQPPPPSRPPLNALMDQWLNPLLTNLDGHTGRILALVQATVAATLGHGVVPLQDLALEKRANHAIFPWHQDQPFWAVDRTDGAVVWIALDGSTAANGGLQLAAGSHRHGRGPPIDLHTGESQAGSIGAVPPGLDSQATCPELAPGDAILFSSLCWHCSGLNTSNTVRRAWAISWIHELARWDFSQAPRHPIRGLVADGSEVSLWSRKNYPSQLG